jgi:hypothetical protein
MVDGIAVSCASARSSFGGGAASAGAAPTATIAAVVPIRPHTILRNRARSRILRPPSSALLNRRMHEQLSPSKVAGTASTTIRADEKKIARVDDRESLAEPTTPGSQAAIVAP